MKLKEWDEKIGRNGDWREREYPDTPIKEFVDWLRNTKQWREAAGMHTGPHTIYTKFLVLERELADIRNSQAGDSGQCTALTASGSRCRHDAVSDGLCGIHRKQLQVA
jgi:Family of unknown function (DUF5763)